MKLKKYLQPIDFWNFTFDGNVKVKTNFFSNKGFNIYKTRRIIRPDRKTPRKTDMPIHKVRRGGG